MPSPLDALSRKLPLKFTRLLNAVTLNDAGPLALVIANERHPLIDGIPILLKETASWRHAIPPDRRAMASLLQEGSTSPAPFPSAGQMAPKI